MFTLDGKTALLVGSDGKLGPIWRRALERAGATVVTWGLPEHDIRQETPSLVPDVLVLNAGVDDRPDTEEPWPFYHLADRMLDVNVRANHRLLVEVGGRMPRGGSIVVVASLYGLTSPDKRYYDHRQPPWMKSAMYGASKAALISLVKYFAAFYGPNGVRVNAIAPGGVINPSDKLTAGDPQFMAKYTARIPMGRMCWPADLEGALVFLASDASGFVSGHTLPLDGGFLCW